MVSASIQQSTQKQYQTQFTVWKNFLMEYRTGESSFPVNLKGLPEPEKIRTVLAFLAFLYFEKELGKSTIQNYVSGIRFHIELSGEKTNCFDEVVIKKFGRGAALRDAELGRYRDKKRPIPLALIWHIVNNMLDRTNPDDAPYRIAVMIAYFFLLRQSEYIFQRREGSHAIRACDVEFRTTTGQFVQSHLLQKINLEDVNLVKITLRHCKNDPFRQGNSFWCERCSVDKSNHFDLVRELFVFSTQANLLGTDVYTSYRQNYPAASIIRVTYKRMMQLLSGVAKHFNLSPSLFGTHSFRISGATTLDAGHNDSAVVQKMGRWKSLPTSLEYSQASTSAFRVAHEILADPSVFTVADLQLQIHTKAIHDAQRIVLPGVTSRTEFLPRVSTSVSRRDEDYPSDEVADEP
jgi:hypothetical protein